MPKTQNSPQKWSLGRVNPNSAGLPVPDHCGSSLDLCRVQQYQCYLEGEQQGVPLRPGETHRRQALDPAVKAPLPHAL
jgi:hypothetical protein